MDLEQRLRESYDERLGSLDTTPGDVAAAQRTGQRMRARRRLSVAAAAVAVAAVGVAGTVVGIGGRGAGPAGSTGRWVELPAPPLSQRSGAIGVWNGHEAIVLGGAAGYCAPNDDSCAVAPEFRDAAAYVPSQHRWHRIADVPVKVGSGDQLLAAGERVVLRHLVANGSTYFVYDPGADEWTPIRSLKGRPSTVGHLLYGFAGDHVARYDARSGLWTELPPDRIRPSLTQRQITGTSVGPVVTGYATTPGSDAQGHVVFADVYDGKAWHRLPATGQTGNDEWFWTGTQMVDPQPGTPSGGVLDPRTGRWHALPATFTDELGSGWGAVNASAGRWVASYGKLYDTDSGEVATLPRPDGAPDDGVASVWAGNQLLAFGGASTHDGVSLTNRAWLYTP
ncbi:MAG: hypothetical protein QM747_11445 [Nocardioides sp.]